MVSKKNLFLLLAFGLFLSSCSSNKRLAYFNQKEDTSFTLSTKNLQPLIQVGDLLNIAVNSLDPQSSIIFNSQNALTSIGMSNPNNPSILPGTMVDNNGNIQLPKLGKIKAAGKTKQELTNDLQIALEPYLKDPIVNIRFNNFRITVLGEVNRPGTITIPNDRVTILEAIGFAGDLTQFGKRDNVILMRYENGKQEVKHLDLSENSIFTSPYFYLQSTDVVYIEPNNGKSFSGTKAQVLLPSILAGLSFLVIILDQVLN